MTIGLLTSSIRQIDVGQVGVIYLFGNVSDRALNSGLNFVNPAANVTEFDIRTQNYIMSASNDEGQKQGDDAICVLTADVLEIVIDLTVLYRLVPENVPQIYRQIGTDFVHKIVRPITRIRIRDKTLY